MAREKYHRVENLDSDRLLLKDKFFLEVESLGRAKHTCSLLRNDAALAAALATELHL